MTTTRTRTTDWTAGELTPLLAGRVDLDKFARGAERAENMLLLSEGGWRRRPGSRYVATALGQATLIPFIFSEQQAFVLEFTAGHIRPYRNTALIGGVDIPTTYLVNELIEIRYAQSADVLDLVHPLHPAAILERLKADGTLWRLRDVVFPIPATREFGLRGSQLSTTVTPSATTGAGITLTASGATFLASDVNRTLRVIAGASVGAKALVTAFTDTTHVTATVQEAFASTAALAPGEWVLSDSPKTSNTPSVKSPVGVGGTLTLALDGWRPSDVARYVKLNGGQYVILSYVSPTVVNVQVVAEANDVTAAPSGVWSLEEPAWSTFNGYPSEVTFFRNRHVYLATPAQQQTVWLSRIADYYNYAVGVLDDDALVGTLNSDKVNAIRWAVPSGDSAGVLHIGTSGDGWVIAPGDNQTLTPATFPDATRPATAFGSGPVRPVRVGHVVLFCPFSRRKLRELAIDPANLTGSISYTAPDLTRLAGHITEPYRVGPSTTSRAIAQLAWQREPFPVVWAPRDDGALLSQTYVREENVVGWARQVFNDQYPTVATVDDRMMPSTDRVESSCVIPHPDGDRDQVWLSVARVVGGVTVRHIEVFDDRGLNFTDGLTVDAAVTYDGRQTVATLTLSAVTGAGVTFTATSPVFAAALLTQGGEIRDLASGARATLTGFTSTTVMTGTVTTDFLGLSLAAGAWGIAVNVISGLGHLEGREVAIVGDGAVYPNQTVSAGAVGLGVYPAVLIEAGVPFSSRLVTNPPEMQALGTIQGIPKRAAKMYLRLYKSLGVTIQGVMQPFRLYSDPMGQGVPLYTGDLDVTDLGWTTDGTIDIRQTQPLPLTILGLFTLTNVGD